MAQPGSSSESAGEEKVRIFIGKKPFGFWPGGFQGAKQGHILCGPTRGISLHSVSFGRLTNYTFESKKLLFYNSSRSNVYTLPVAGPRGPLK